MTKQNHSDSTSGLVRCPWAEKDISVAYHDREWGVPIHDDRLLFEFLILEGAQAGLSWETILKKREHYRLVYDNFEPELVARQTERKLASLLADSGIVRNRLKVRAAVLNARAFLAVREEFGSFDRYIWNFAGGQPRQNRRSSMGEIPVRTPESDAMSRDLLKRGFKFVGSTICQAYMQAVGMVNDHLTSCFRHDEVGAMGTRRGFRV